MRISTLKKRSDFQRVRGGGRFSGQALVLEGKPRSGVSEPGARFGFTITRKLGGAVVRNRIRRRLKAAIAGLANGVADPRFDYVIVARAPAHEMPFAKLCEELSAAFRRVNEKPNTPRAPNATAKQTKRRPGSPEAETAKDTAS